MYDVDMSAGDITRLNRMYNCQKYEAAPITLNETTKAKTTSTKSPTVFSNGPNIKRVGLNVTKDNTDDDLAKLKEQKSEMDLNPNATQTSDDDDMILSKEQIDALYPLNAAKRNGLKSAFHQWPMGSVAFEIDPTFRKTFSAFTIFIKIFIFFHTLPSNSLSNSLGFFFIWQWQPKKKNQRRRVTPTRVLLVTHLGKK